MEPTRLSLTFHAVPDADGVVARWVQRHPAWVDLAQWLDDQPGVEEVRLGRYGLVLELAGHVVTPFRFLERVLLQLDDVGADGVVFQARVGDPLVHSALDFE